MVLALSAVFGSMLYVVLNFVDIEKYRGMPEWQFQLLFLAVTVPPGIIAMNFVGRLYQITCLKCSVGKLTEYYKKEYGPIHHRCKFCGAEYFKYLLVEQDDA